MVRRFLTPFLFTLLLVSLTALFLFGSTTKQYVFQALALEETMSLPIFDNALSSQFINWSWSTVTSFTSSISPDGSYSINTQLAPWGGFYLHTDTPIQVEKNMKLTFQARSGQEDTQVRLLLYGKDNTLLLKDAKLDSFGGALSASTWKSYSVPLSDILPQGSTITGIALQETAGRSNQSIYLDQIFLTYPRLLPIATPTPTSVISQVTLANSTSSTSNEVMIFDETLSSNFSNWSWNATISPTSPGYNTNAALKVSANGWGALYLHTDQPLLTKTGDSVTFVINPTQDNTQLSVLLFDEENVPTSPGVPIGSLSKNIWKQVTFPLSSFKAEGRSIKGLAIQETGGKNQQVFVIDSLSFSTTSPNSSSSPSLISTTPTLTPTQSTGYSVNNNKMYKNGSPITLKGVNWFGFETETQSIHGLWVRNWKEYISQMKSLGFNAVRVPFCPDTLRSQGVSGISYDRNKDLVGLNSLQLFDKVIQELNNQQLYVLLDHHRPDCKAISELWYTSSYSESQWISDLELVAKRYAHLEYFLGIDLKNEPHGKATWGVGNSQTDWNTAAEKAGKAVLAANPNLLLFVQGIQENSTCSTDYGHWMGGNFEPMKCTPLSLPQDKLVLSPHVYGPDVYQQVYFTAPNFPSNMTSFWDTHFGFLAEKGYTIVPGEWGGKYGVGDQKDVILQDSLTSYFTKKGICNSFYWSFNPNSTDTGGILKDDWTSVWDNKMKLINTYTNNCK